MARKTYYIGSQGPFFYDEGEPTPDGAEEQNALSTEGQMKVEGTPTQPNQTVRLEDIEGAISADVFTEAGQLIVSAGEGAFTIIPAPEEDGFVLTADSELPEGVGWTESTGGGGIVAGFSGAIVESTQSQVLPPTVSGPASIHFQEVKVNSGDYISQDGAYRFHVSEDGQYLLNIRFTTGVPGHSGRLSIGFWTSDKVILSYSIDLISGQSSHGSASVILDLDEGEEPYAVFTNDSGDDFLLTSGSQFSITKIGGVGGASVPPGGGVGQALVKLSGADYDVGWKTIEGGGGGGLYTAYIPFSLAILELPSPEIIILEGTDV